jgi:hypothetical protein
MIGRISIAALALLSASTFFTQEKAARGSNINFETMRKDLETMRRILGQDIRGTTRTSGTGNFTMVDELTYFSSEGTSDAAYVPGIGALFTARVNIPLVGPSPADEAKDTKPPSRWDDVRAEVDGKSGHSFRVSTRAYREFDPKAVDAMRDRVLTSLGSFGANIGQLSDDQSIVVVLRSNSYGRVLSTRRAPTAQTGNTNETPPTTAESKGDIEENIVYANTLYGISGNGISGSQTSVMSLSVSLADCKAMHDGAMKIEEFIRRAKVAQY